MSYAAEPGPATTCRGCVVGLEAATVVPDVEEQLVGLVGQRDDGPGGAGVLDDVRHRAPGGAEDGARDGCGHRDGLAVDPDLDPDLGPDPVRGLLDRAPQREGQCVRRPVPDIGRGEVAHDPPYLVEAFPRGGGCRPHMRPRGLGTRLPVLLGRLEQQVDARQPLPDGVVDVARQPGPLGEGPGLPLGDGQVRLCLGELVEQPLPRRGLPLQRAERDDGDERDADRANHDGRVEAVGDPQPRHAYDDRHDDNEPSGIPEGENPQHREGHGHGGPRERRCDEGEGHPERDHAEHPADQPAGPVAQEGASGIRPDEGGSPGEDEHAGGVERVARHVAHRGDDGQRDEHDVEPAVECGDGRENAPHAGSLIVGGWLHDRPAY